MRTIIFDGIIGSDAEIKHNGNGDFLLMRVVSHEYIGGQSDDSEYNEDSYWFDVITSNDGHIKLAQYLTKGRRVRIMGKYTDGIYVSKNGTGISVSRKVRAFDIELCDRKKSSAVSEKPIEDNSSNDGSNSSEELPF